MRWTGSEEQWSGAERLLKAVESEREWLLLVVYQALEGGPDDLDLDMLDHLLLRVLTVPQLKELIEAVERGLPKAVENEL